MKALFIQSRRLLPTVTLAAVGIWLVLGLMTWHELGQGVRVGFPQTTNEYGQHLLFDGSPQVLAVVSVIVLHICAAILGYALVVNPIWGRRRLTSEAWLMAAGIIPGTLLLITLSRTLSLVLPNTIAPFAVIFVILISSVITVAHLFRRSRTASLCLRRQDLLMPCMLLVGLAVLGVQLDRFHISGEASTWFMNEVYLSDAYGIGVGSFPLVSQHYDEAALLYPIIYGLMHRGANVQVTFSTLYWIMDAFGRVGISSLLYLSLRSLGVDRLSSLITLGFVCAASLSINIISARLLFDSLSPLIFALHMARYLIPVLPLILVSALLALEGKSTSISAISIAAALGIGLSAMPVHAIIVLAWTAAVVAITQIAPTAAGSPKLWRAATFAGLIVIMSFALAYGLGKWLPASACVVVLFGGAAIGGLAIAQAWITSHSKFGLRGLLSTPVFVAFGLCAGYLLGLLLFGNIFIPHTDALLSHIWPWAQHEIAVRPVGDLAGSSGGLMKSPYCAGYAWAYRTLAGHCSSLPMLVRTYGLAFAAIVGVIAWWTRTLPTSSLQTERQRTMILCGLVLCLLAMPASFIDYDFVSPANAPLEWERQLSIWLRSRLVEPWFYSGILLAFAFFLREASTKHRRWLQSAMLVAVGVWGLSPLVVPAQLIVNFGYLFGTVHR